MDERRQLGQRLKSLRLLRGYTQEQLAERIEINPKYLSSIERGVENPTLDLLCRLANGLQVDLYELFQFEPDAAQPQRLRRKLEGLVAEIRAEELSRVVRVLKALVH
jgi:XRE family transcriptional regulator, regulator of sulfur utilization